MLLRQPVLAGSTPGALLPVASLRQHRPATALAPRPRTASALGPLRRRNILMLTRAAGGSQDDPQQQQQQSQESSTSPPASSPSTGSTPAPLPAPAAATETPKVPADPAVEATEAALRGFARAAAEIFKLTVLLPLRYLVVAPMAWALTRLGLLAVSPSEVLGRLEAANAAAKVEADKVAEVLRALNRHHPGAVVDFVERRGLLLGPDSSAEAASESSSSSGGGTATKSGAQTKEPSAFAVNAAVVREYMVALVRSGRIKEYVGVGEAAAAAAAVAAESSEAGITASLSTQRSLERLLEEMRAAAAGAPLPAAPGASPLRPLHVVVSAAGASALLGREPTGWLATLYSWVWFLGVCIFFGVAWAVGAATVRRLSAGSSLGSSGIAGAPGIAATGSTGMLGAPKEYSKENIPEKSVKSFRDVKGCDEAITELQEIVEYLKSPEKFTRLGGKLPKGVLLTGPPGTGKTLLARAVAGEAGVPFFYKAGSEFDEMFVGVGSRRVRSLFAAAKKKAPCIVFIDEIDAVGGRRTTWEASGGSRKTLNQLLTDMDGFEENSGVVVMAATNLPEFLDPALTRPGRFDRRVAVALPDVRGRRQILDLYLNGKPIAADVDPENLARRTPGFSGAQLANLVNEAALLAARADAPAITASLLDEARDKVLMGSPRSLVQTPEARKLTAYHEGGHALVALYTPGAKSIHKATIQPRGHALGMVLQLPDKDEYSTTRQQMRAHIDVCMGGKAAEELIFGPDKVTSGATSDLKTATALARHMVEQCGMSERIGPLALSDGSGGGGDASSAIGPEVRRAADEEVSQMLKDSYARVAALLKEKESELHALAAALLERETLSQREIKALLWGEEAVAQEDAERAEAEAAEEAAMEAMEAAREAARAAAAATAAGSPSAAAPAAATVAGAPTESSKQE